MYFRNNIKKNYSQKLKMNKFTSIFELNFVNGDDELYNEISKLVNKVYDLTEYYASVGIEVSIIELFNFAQNYISGNYNSRILASVFDIACSRISNMDVLYDCYKKTIMITNEINVWNKWTDDFHKSFFYTLCNNNCVNGINIIIKMFPLIKGKFLNASLFTCVCKYGTQNSIPVLEILVIETPSELLEKELNYIVNSSISNDKDDPSILQWVFEKWPEAVYLLDNSHISSAGFPGNINCIQFAFSVNSNIELLDNVLLGTCYNSNIPILEMLLDYNPKLDLGYLNSVCFLKYAKSSYNQHEDLTLARYFVSKRPYKFILTEKDNYMNFSVRTNEEEKKLQTRYQMLAISKQKNNKNLLWRISDDVDRMIIQYI